MTYEEFITQKKSEPIPEIGQVHHIIPKALGGDDSPQNLIKLTYADHLKAHVLLMRKYPYVRGLAYAVQKMFIYENIEITDEILNDAYYESLVLNHLTHNIDEVQALLIDHTPRAVAKILNTGTPKILKYINQFNLIVNHNPIGQSENLYRHHVPRLGEYLKTHSVKEASKKFQCSPHAVKKAIADYNLPKGLDYVNERMKITYDNVKEIEAELTSGKTPSALAKKYGISGQGMESIILRFNLKVINRKADFSKPRPSRRKILDKEVLQELLEKGSRKQAAAKLDVDFKTITKNIQYHNLTYTEYEWKNHD